MNFIELTGYKTGRTIYVRADRFDVVTDYVNDEEGEAYTVIRPIYGGESDDLHVRESPAEVIQRIATCSATSPSVSAPPGRVSD